MRMNGPPVPHIDDGISLSQLRTIAFKGCMLFIFNLVETTPWATWHSLGTP